MVFFATLYFLTIMGGELKINKILSAVDLGPDTEKVIAYALWLSGAGGAEKAEIDMLYVMDYALTPPGYLMPYIEKEKKTDEKELEKWVLKLKPYGIASKHVIASGRLVETFNVSTKDLNADILVLGHKSHMIRPSSSERLIKSLDIPMMVVRGKKSENARLGSVNIKRILCAVDFSGPSKKALEFAKLLSENTSSELTVAHVVSSVKMEKGLQKWKDMTEADRSGYKDALVKEAEERMCSFLNVCDRAKSVVRIGVPYTAVNDIAAEIDVDLIVMGARGLSYTKGVMLGSVSESIIKSSPCPAVITR
ncbi:MAG TPA: hypothetical protein DHV16_03020 [Nitrospiraceae bacterium]|nr:MAG: hypothetical protein A2Z82_10495 [Nitrospirae bacterium GWA2_46_11]OGW24640.1 MAG: hypothetical protein A2X55_06465 [Nitrospirae bacterium GWB2_47_37]HAK88073.1 hypothetical protein [Nitrospiraceae bacterium]HCL81532.1 hypothetical protein [Nitrospiraceae bacterium]HCZ11234.1 hypothetical protein [Nitrospiraceae bacterium]